MTILSKLPSLSLRDIYGSGANRTSAAQSPIQRLCLASLSVISIAIVLLLIPGLSASAAAPERANTESAQDLESFLDDVMAGHFEQFDLAGAVVTVVQDGEILVSKGYGHADRSAEVPVDAETTLFPTASVAKLFTWTAVMQLVEQGKLDLDADVNDYLTGFQIPDTFPEPVRVWHLLSHTTGFEDRPQVGAYTRKSENLPELEAALIDYVPERAWEPGLYTAYSNYGAALAGQLVAEASGMRWEDYVEAKVFGPLGMTRSSASQPLPEALAPDVAKVYVDGEDGLVEAMFEYSVLAPAGAIVTTGQDMGRFMLAHLQEGRMGDVHLLEEATVEEMRSQLFTHDPRLPGNAHGFWESDENGHHVISHAGDLNTAHALLALVPERELGFYVSYNSHEGAVRARDELWAAFVDYALPRSNAPTEATPTDPQASISHLAGSYGVNRVSTTTLSKLFKLISVITVTAEGENLVTHVPGGEDQRWAQAGRDEFEEVGGPGRMIFGLSDDGKVSHVVFNGTSMTAFSPLIAFFPVPWYDSPALHVGLLVTSLLLIISTLTLWPILAFIRRRRDGTNAKGARFARRWAAVTGSIFLVFIVLVALAVGNFTEIEYGITPLLWFTLILGGVAALFTLGAVAHTVRAWRGGYWGVAGRLHYTLLSLTFVALVWQMSHWNLLGIQA